MPPWQSWLPPRLGAEGEQPDILEMRFDLTVWSIVVFVLLFLVLRKFAWGPILDGLTKREQSIEGSLVEAKKVREELAQQQAEFQKQLAEANQQIPKLLEAARRDAEHLKEEMRSPGRGRHQHRTPSVSARDRGRQGPGFARDLGSGRQPGHRDLRSCHSQTLAPEDHRRLLDEALTEIQGETLKHQDRASEIGLEWVRRPEEKYDPRPEGAGPPGSARREFAGIWPGSTARRCSMPPSNRTHPNKSWRR